MDYAAQLSPQARLRGTVMQRKSPGLRFVVVTLGRSITQSAKVGNAAFYVNVNQQRESCNSKANDPQNIDTNPSTIAHWASSGPVTTIYAR